MANFPDRCVFKNILDFMKGKGNSSCTVPGKKHLFSRLCLFNFVRIWDRANSSPFYSDVSFN